MKRLTCITLLFFCVALLHIGTTPLLSSEQAAKNKPTELEELLESGTAEEIKEWLGAHNKVTAENKALWEIYSYRIGLVNRLHQKIEDPLLKAADKAKIASEITQKTAENLQITKLILSAADQSSLDLLIVKEPPHIYPQLSSLLYGFCDAQYNNISDGQKYVTIFIEHAKGKIWFDDFGLFDTYMNIATLKDNEARATCLDNVAGAFIREEDWHHLEDKDKVRALLKRVTELYKR